MQAFNTIYDKLESTIIDTLNKAQFISLTIDLWSDRRLRSYIGITAHFVTNHLFRYFQSSLTYNFFNIYIYNMKRFNSIVLSCRKIAGSHTGELILAEYKDIIKKYQIESKIVKVLCKFILT